MLLTCVNDVGKTDKNPCRAHLQQRGNTAAMRSAGKIAHGFAFTFTFNNKSHSSLLQTPRKAIAEKYNLSPASVGSILLKGKEIEAGISQGINPKRKKFSILQKNDGAEPKSS